YSDTGRPGARFHSAHEQPPRALTAPARLSGMLCRHTAAVNPVTQPGRISADAPRRSGTTASIAPTKSRSGRGRRGTGARPRAGESEVREDLSDDGGIVQRGDQPQPAPTMRACEDIHRERVWAAPSRGRGATATVGDPNIVSERPASGVKDVVFG